MNINDLEMVVKLLEWILLEGIVGRENLCYKHVGLFSNNTAAVSWTKRGVAKSPQQQDHCSESYIFGNEWQKLHR